ncbi:MAG: hypothetical protein WHT81_06825, partial [Rectinemataceae bacterium]
ASLRETFIAGSEFLFENNLFRAFEQRIQKALKLDIFFLRSSFFQRWLLDITSPAGPVSAPLAEYLKGTELYAGKYITDMSFAHFILMMKQDPIESAGVLALDLELGLELESPFGLLNWSMSLGRQGGILNNQKLSLSWRLRY